MHLSDLPVDVLAQILDGEASWNALTLWKTGDPQMQNKLRSGGITHMDLCFTPIELPSYTWPRCLKEFRLRSLSVKCGRPLLLLHELRAELMRMHIGLKSLALSFPGGVEAFSDDAKCLVADDDSEDDQDDNNGQVEVASDAEVDSDDEESDEERPTKIHKFFEVEAPEGSLSDLWDPHTAFPSLETLSLTYASSKASGIQFESGLLSMVPNSVKHFTAANSPLKWSALPQGLESLLRARISYDEDPIEVLKLLPKTLTRLDCSHDWKPVIDVLHEELPNLIEEGYWRLEEADTCPSFVQATVSLIVLLSQRSAPLPSHIQKLSMRKLEMEFVHTLPASLTNFGFRESNMSETTILPLWPRALTHLHLDGHLPPHHFHLLPRTLTSLSTKALRIRKDATVPSSVEVSDLLRLGLSSVTGADAHAWNTARQELIEYGKTRRGIDSGFVAAYIAHVESGGLWGLPLSLTNINISSKMIEPDMNMILPPRVRRFAASAETNAFDSLLFFDLLPPYITELSIEGDPRNFGLLKQSNPSLHFHNMPFLHHMTISATTTSSPELYVAMIPLLPRGLLRLQMRCVLPPIDASVLLGLPPTLIELYINPRGGITPPNAWLHSLPRSLEEVVVSRFQSSMDGSDLINLPPGLKDLSAPMLRLTIDELFTLPRSIRRFEIDLPLADDEGEALELEEETGATLSTLNILNTDIWTAMRHKILPFNRIWAHRSLIESWLSAWCQDEDEE